MHKLYLCLPSPFYEGSNQCSHAGSGDPVSSCAILPSHGYNPKDLICRPKKYPIVFGKVLYTCAELTLISICFWTIMVKA